MQGIIQYLNQQGYGTPSGAFYSAIELWEKWYKGKTPFHVYNQWNGVEYRKNTRKTLNMAKKIAEDWANLLLNEKVEIVTGSEAAQDRLEKILNENSFWVRGNQLIELTMALGTCAFVEFLDGDKVNIDYVRADMIYPLTTENGEILDCAFASEHQKGKDKFVYLNIHERNAEGNYIIKNVYFKRTGETLQPAALPEGVAEEIDTHSTTPRFQIIKPNIVNNVEFDNPMGISIYANSVDQLEALDLVYDSYANEFQLGKKRIIVPLKFAKIMESQDGTASYPVFDPNDTAFTAITESDGNNKIIEMNMEIRADAHEQGLKTALNILAKKCGLGDSYYRFETSGVKTATEVISEESDLYRNLRKHEIVLGEALRKLVMAISELGGFSVNEEEITINFDDSIIEDTGAEKEKFLQEIRDGIRDKWEYRVRFFGETEEEAKANIPDQAESNDNWFGGEE